MTGILKTVKRNAKGEEQMAKEKTKVIYKGAHLGGMYFLAFLGALVYFLNKADGAGEVLLAFLQALVWPVLLIYRVFQVLNI